MKYLLYTMITHANGITSTVVSFDSLDSATQARSDFLKISKHGTYGTAVILSNAPSKDSIFLELLKANPYGNVEELMNKASEALAIITKGAK